ncbi:MAG: hypothetical protein QNJ45_21520 [Ardenticatenaceae bacterium]|nr:hypothetical protein [Ardenticatenaceae bacterium]
MLHSPHYPDLSPYPSEIDEVLGLQPLAVGWLHRRKSFAKKKSDPRFVARLSQFCRPDNHAFPFRPPLRCALENHAVDPLQIDGEHFAVGGGEIRVIGHEEIFAAPDLILHYVVVHQYQPPPEFVSAVMHGPAPDSAEFRAFIRAIQNF